MVASPREARAPRSPLRARAQSSADVLLELITREPAAEVLGAHGLGPGDLLAAREGLSDVLGPEPADWRLRLSTRGGDGGDLSLLLAISRSADSHAYQLLEQLGVSCSRLRKEVIERIRADGEAQLRRASRSAGPTASATSAASGANFGVRPNRRTATVRPPSELGSVRTTARHARSPFVRASRSPPTTDIDVQPEPPREEAPARERRAEQEPRAEAVVRPVEVSTLPTLHGRQSALTCLADALGRKRIRVPLLVGPPGSGRTLLALHVGTVLGEPIYRLDATAYEDEEALTDDLDKVHRAGGIAVLDDLDRVPCETAPPFLGALSHAWTIGKPRMLTVVSPETHGRLSQWLPTIVHSADALHLEPLRGGDLESAIRAAAPSVLAEHGVQLAADAKLGELTRLAERYLTGPAMPGRALDLLDLACARARRAETPVLHRAMWIDIVSERSGLPASRIEVRGDRDALELEARLGRRVVGHEHAVSTIARLIRRNRAGFGGCRPVLSALLLGPSGVGKTELAKALSAALYEREDALVRLDMSEYSESHAVARIVGAPPGYVGHDQGGALTEPLLGRPHCVLLLDEIEKAHRDVHQLLLQVFDDGRLTDGRGRTVDFRHAAIIMTSNLGAGRLTARNGSPHMDENEVLAVARAAFPVELWNRIEAPLVMHPLTRGQMGRICRRLTQSSSDRLFRERGIRYSISDRACEHLVSLASRDPSLGARPLRHLMVRDVESAVADAILRGKLRAGTQAQIDLQTDLDGGLKSPRLVLR